MERPQEERLGARLRRLRLERGLAQRDLVGPGISHGYISLIERGLRRPSMDVLRALADRLDVSVNYLESGDGYREPLELEVRLGQAEVALRLAEDPVQLESTFRDLLVEARRSSNEAAHGRARIALGRIAAHAGRFADAILQLEGVLRHSPSISPLSHPDLYITLAHAYVEVGRGAEGVVLLERALDHVANHGAEEHPVWVQFAHCLSAALDDIGEFERARQMLDLAAARLRRASDADADARARLYWSYARLFASNGDFRAADENIRVALALLRDLDDSIGFGRANLMRATILLAQDRLDEAADHLLVAERLLLRLGSAQTLAMLRAEQAKLAARRGRAELAVGYARDALSTIGDGDAPTRGFAEWALAEALATRGDMEDARAALTRARRLLEPRYVPEMLRAWAATLVRCGDPIGARTAEARLARLLRETN